MAYDPIVAAHKQWIGYLQPEGLVVSPQVLAEQQVIIDRSGMAALQAQFLDSLRYDADDQPVFGPFLKRGLDLNPEGFALRFLGWSPRLVDLDGDHDNERGLHPSACAAIPELDAVLRPTAALRHPRPEDPQRPYILLTQELAPGTDLDKPIALSHLWEPTPTARFERLLTETGVPLGVLSNGQSIRICYAPRTESAGHMTFQVAHMVDTAGRPMVAGLHGLLQQLRLVNPPGGQSLLKVCETSRKYQAKVSEQLSQQVLAALYELVRGFQAADNAKNGDLLRDLLGGTDDSRQDVYRGLLRTLMRSVFLLFAEDRGLLPTTGLYTNHYSLHGLYERLRIDDGKHHDTMDHRYGAWAQMLTLFRLVYHGSTHADLRLPARHGYLFDPDLYPFLEGRTLSTPAVPLVSDGCIHRVLEKLLILDGERLSYRTLDVEQIGSVYETMMGFTMTVATGRSLAIKPRSKHGAPTGINLETLLAKAPASRAKHLEAEADTTLTPTQKKALQAATTIDQVEAALRGRIVVEATPRPVPAGGMLLQPSQERRKSGSHYTPRSLTEPIVRTTLAPILERLGPEVRPDQILDLKICDPAMGSGAFLVEVCRQLGKHLEQAWIATKTAPATTAEDDLYRLACRTVAQRCLYGVDRNDMAVDLAKLSLWLVTLARDHSFTFLDHALRHGDSLVGLNQAQLEAFHWDPSRTVQAPVRDKRGQQLAKVRDLRRSIREAADTADEATLSAWWSQAQQQLDYLRTAGDLVVSVYSEGGKPGDQNRKLTELARDLRIDDWQRHRPRLRALRSAHPPLVPFHWDLEYPEVFDRTNPGFDAFVGNPPYAGKNTRADGNAPSYLEWLKSTHVESHGNADVVAHFFRRCFDLLRKSGNLGFIATNTIAQGDTRSSGLRWICSNGGTIYSASRRVRWPGTAAVVPSVVHIHKGQWSSAVVLDGKLVETITAFLFHAGGHNDPERLQANAGKSFVGSYVLGMGFTFDDTDTKGVASSLDDMKRLLAANPRNREVIFPYIGGEEVNSDPRHAHHRYVINFGDRPEAECRAKWPELMDIVERRVKPDRISLPPKNAWNKDVAARWWQFGAHRKGLDAAIEGLDRVLAVTCGASPYANFTFLPQRFVFANTLAVFPLRSYAAFAALQSRLHEHWARFLGSSMKDDLRYTPSDCFETFPFPEHWQDSPTLEAAGKAYYDYRAQLMVNTNLGLTKTYNRFHDPDEHDPAIQRLRELHAAMDRAVLEAYGWSDIPTDCEFIPDYIETDDEGNETPKSIRYRWPDAVRDEVLARLLDLNERRHKAEVAAGLHAKGGKRNKDMFDEDDDS